MKTCLVKAFVLWTFLNAPMLLAQTPSDGVWQGYDGEWKHVSQQLFGAGSFALLIPNPLMPASVAHSHLWETLLSDLLLGAIVGWVLG